MRRIGHALGVTAALTACSPLARPIPGNASATIPGRWVEPVETLGRIDKHWWRAFGDPFLDALEARAVANNVDVLTAIARIEESRSNVALARAQYLPTLDATLGVTRSRTFILGQTIESTQVQPEGMLSWQLDLFGRLRNQKRAAALEYLATSIDRDGTVLSVASQTAQAYFGLLALDAQLTVTLDTLKAREIQLRSQRDKTISGYDSQFELTQVQSEYDSVANSIPDLERRIRQQELALTVLLGDTPGSTISRGDIRRIIMPAVPASLPSELLRRRPDLASGELRIAAADATLAGRRAEFLPQVSLSASGGALLINTLNYNPISIWSIGASLLQPIFAGGRLTAQVDQATARRNQAAYDYKNSVLTAFRDVLGGLTAITTYRRQIDVTRSRRATLVRSVELASDRYFNGYSSNLDRLDAQRNLYSVELAAITLHRDQLNNIVQLAVALGGGWTRQAASTYAPSLGLPEPIRR